MAGLFSKVAVFSRSPQGRAAIAKAKHAANDPKNRQKVDDLVAKVKDKGKKLGQTGQASATAPPVTGPPVTGQPGPPPQPPVTG